MIVEPQEFNDRLEFVKSEAYKSPTAFIIALNSTAIYARQVGLFDRGNIVFLAWRYTNGDMAYAIPSNSQSTSGEFLDFLFVEYPDHAEWFLFHLEWL